MNEFSKILTENILPFWIDKMQDHENGGFYGRMDGNGRLYPKANKGAVLHARILWTFSAAYRVLGNEKYRLIADNTFDYICQYFIDKEYGGTFWELDYLGNPVDTKKQAYAQGFMLYGFSEYYRATQTEKALELAKDFYFLIEEKCKDHENGGYFEAFKQDWSPIEDMRLSEKDFNEKKSMNTHLHILEPYTNLCRIWNDPGLLKVQKELIAIFTNRILNQETFHLNLFFDENWNIKSNAISYGHDIEASWLLVEAAEVLGDEELIESTQYISLKIADSAKEGLMTDASLIYEKEETHLDKERHWWVQAEAVVGFLYAWRSSGIPYYKDIAIQTWEYIQNQLVDFENGEWYWSRLEDGTINRKDDKAGFWKCPYHNGRMCFEAMELLKPK